MNQAIGLLHSRRLVIFTDGRNASRLSVIENKVVSLGPTGCMPTDTQLLRMGYNLGIYIIRDHLDDGQCGVFDLVRLKGGERPKKLIRAF